MRIALRCSAFKFHINACLVALTSLTLGLTAVAQSTQSAARPDRGTTTVGSYSVSDIESVSLTNGNVNLSIPLAALPPIIGGKLSLGLHANYNSKLWDVVRAESPKDEAHPNLLYVIDTPQLSPNGGWRLFGGYSLVPHGIQEDFDFRPVTDPGDPDHSIFSQYGYSWYKLILTTPDGATHELRPLDYPAFWGSRDFLKGYYKDSPDNLPVPSPMRYYSVDGSYLYLVRNPSTDNVAWTLYMPDGTKVIQRSGGVQKIEDTRGHSIWISTSGLITHYQDHATGREITVEFIPSPSDPQFSFAYRVSYPTVDTGSASIDLNFGTSYVQGKTYPTSIPNLLNSASCVMPVLLQQTGIDYIKEIVLPQTEPATQGQPLRQKYTFTYNSEPPTDSTTLPHYAYCDVAPQQVSVNSHGWGSLSQMTTPSGASASYSYFLDAVHNVANDVNEIPREKIIAKTLTHDSITDTWSYSIGDTGGSVTNPDNSVDSESAYNHDPAFGLLFGYSEGLGGLTYKSSRSKKQFVERHWTRKVFNGANDITNGLHKIPFNPVVDAEYTTLLAPDGVTPAQMSAKTFEYDYNGNMTKETDYDWFNPALIQRDTSFPNLPLGVPASATVLRVVTNTHYNPAPVAVDNPSDPDSANVYAKRVMGSPPSPKILNAIKRSKVFQDINESIMDSDTRFSYDEQAFGTAPESGDLSTEGRWDNRLGTWINTSHSYDPLTGNLSTTTDPKGNITQYFYDDAAKALPTRVVVDPLNGTGSQTTTTVYDPQTGLITGQTDANGNTTDTSYVNQLTFLPDTLNRPCVASQPAVNAQRHQTVNIYRDYLRQVETKSDLNAQGDGLLKSRTTRDQIGRVVLTERSENGSTYAISSQTSYKTLPSLKQTIIKTSNPSRGDGAQTDGWTRTTQDDRGRMIEVATFTGSPGSPPPDTGTNSNWTGSVITTHNGNITTVRDQANKQRRSTVDALGRLTKIEEMNAYPSATVYATTNYRYNAVGNLTKVRPGEAQEREFVYDTLSRLREAYNPEQVNAQGQKVAMVYQYDNASNLMSKTGPNGTSVSFTYDGLNRVKTRTLSTSGTFTYNYDTGTNFKSRLVSVTSANGDGYFYDTYDTRGRVTATRQVTGAQPYTMSYVYDLAGNITRQVYPSGRAIVTEYDNAGRIAGVKKDGGAYYAGAGPTDPTNRMQYAAHGAAAAMKLGNGRWEHTLFNSRLQPTEIGVGTGSAESSLLRLQYTYGTNNNNGNVQTQTITGGGLFSQVYSYDDLNRLLEAYEGMQSSPAWKQRFSYDIYGNRNFDLANTTQNVLGPNPAIDAATNRFATGQNYNYDFSGNLIADGTKSYGYDAENKQTGYSNTLDGASATYVYDADGRRVKKTVNGAITVFVYNSGGQLLAEYTSGAAEVSGGTNYVTEDSLGSVRLVTLGNGDVKSRHDYLPFGEELSVNRLASNDYVSDNLRQKFTQKERDSESGLDYFLARYYSSAHGRFTSIDPADAEPRYPQDWNRYTYTLNNPLRYTDPDGEKWAVQYSDGKARFQWYDGDSIPTGAGWEGEWKEYTAGWYIGSAEAIRLDPKGLSGAFALSKDLFSAEDWANLQTADPAHFTHQQQEILYAAASSIVNELPNGQRAAMVSAVTTAIAIGGLQARLSGLGAKPAPKMQRPATPGGMTPRQFGQQVMKWGGSSAEARARIASLTREELERAGVTKQVAKAWRNFYRQEATSGRANPSAAGRAELMEHAVKLLKGN